MYWRFSKKENRNSVCLTRAQLQRIYSSFFVNAIHTHTRCTALEDIPDLVFCSSGGEQPCFQLACNRSVDFRLGASKSGNWTCFLDPRREPVDVDPVIVAVVTVVFVGLCVGDAGRVAGRLELRQLVPVGWHVYRTGDVCRNRLSC